VSINDSVRAEKDRALPFAVMLPLVFFAAFSVGGILAPPDSGNDFQSFYASAQEWSRGSTPYEPAVRDMPNLTPPALLLVFWPFTILPLRGALIVWNLMSLSCLLACVPTISRQTHLTKIETGVLVLALASSALALRLGQLSFWLLALFTMAWQAEHDRRRMRAGTLLGALCVVKPFYGLLFIWLVWRREWRGVGAFVATYALGTGIGLLVVGPAGYVQWLSRLGEISWQGHLFNASVFGIGARVFEPQAVARAAAWTPVTVSPQWHRLATLFGITIVLLLTRRALRGGARDPDRVFAVLGVSGPLLSPLGWIHYLPICVGPVLAVLTRYRSKSHWVLGIVAVCPYAVMVNHRYSPFGTLLIGQWSFLTMFGVLAVLANRHVASGTASARLDLTANKSST